MASPVDPEKGTMQVFQICSKRLNPRDQKKEKIIRRVNKVFIGVVFVALAATLSLCILSCFNITSPIITGIAQVSGVLSLCGCLYFVGKCLCGHNSKRIKPNDIDVIVAGENLK